MFKKLLVTTCLSVVFLSLVLFYCKLPQPPAGPDEVRIDVSLRSSDGKTSGFEITDTVGNQPQIRVIFTLTHYIDSAKIEIISGTTTEQTIPCRYKNAQVDTVYFPVSFTTFGTRTIKLTGFIKDYQSIVSTATLHIMDRQTSNQNQKPVLNVPGIQTVGVGQSVSFVVSATDPDAGQKVSIVVQKKPESATYSADTFKWIPTMADTGANTIIFVATDDGSFAMSTTDSVVINVSTTPTNRAPKWSTKNIQRTVKPGVLLTYDLGSNCSDPDNDTITFSIVPEPPAKDTIIGTTYSFKPAITDTGKYVVHIIARDPSGLVDTLVLGLTITSPEGPDMVPPVITFQSPSKDTIISVDSLEVKVICVDDSGCSVKGYLGGTAFDVKKSTSVSNLWTGKVKGLTAGAYSIIKIVATDSSKARNEDSVSVRIKYDNDKTGPALTLVKPTTKSTATNTSSYSIEMKYTDASGVLSVNGALGTSSISGTRSGDNWAVTVSNLTMGNNVVVITATDSSLRANKTLDTIIVKYDPTMDDADGPTIKQLSGPLSGMVVSDSSITIIDTIFDPSGIDSVYWTLNGGTTKQMTAVAGKTGHYSLSATLSKENANTIVITSVDKSTQHNRSTQTIELNYVIAPKISVQPQSNKLCPGSPASVSVIATGTATLKYQWRNSNGNIANATSATYEISSLMTTTVLTCVVSNGAATSATSNPCTLTVLPAVTVTVSPENAQACNGIISTFTATASGGSGFEYQWYKGASPNGITVTGETAPSLRVTVSDATAGDYYCIAKNNTGCSGISSGVTLAKNQAVSVIINSTTTAICSGESITLTAVPTGGTSHTFQWYSGTQKVGTSSSQYIAGAAGTYRCEATSSSGCMGSGQIVITSKTLSTAPTLRVKNNGSTSVCSGGSVDLEIASGTLGTNAVWKWYNNGTATSNDGKTAITAYPTQASTVYSVKGVGDCGEGPAGTITITLKTVSLAASSVTTSADTVCPNADVTLRVAGGTLGSNASWNWYTNSTCTQRATGTLGGISNSQIAVKPSTQTTYYVRAEGDCGNSDAVSKLIRLKKEATPAQILTSDTICPGYEIQLTRQGGDPGDGGKWVWRKHFVTGDILGTNLNSVTDNITATTNYYLVAEGGCKSVWTQARVVVFGPTITSQTQGPIIGPKAADPNGTHIDLDVEITGGSGSYTYKWFHNGVYIPDSPIGSLGSKYSGGWDSAHFGFVGFLTEYSGIFHCEIRDSISDCIISSKTIVVTITEN